MMDQSFLAEKPEKPLSSESGRNRDNIASSDWEFLDALLSMSSLESLDSLSALEMSKFYFSHR